MLLFSAFKGLSNLVVVIWLPVYSGRKQQQPDEVLQIKVYQED